MSSSPQVALDAFDPLWRCLPQAEAGRLREVLTLLDGLEPRQAADVLDVFQQALRSLPPVAAAVLACPSVLQSQKLGGRERSAESLIDALCQSEDGTLEFVMPTGAVLGRAFVLAKLNFLKALGFLLELAGERARAAAAQVREIIGDTIFSKLAEELLTGAISNPHNPLDLKRAAAQKLVGMWSDRLRLPVGEFPTALLSAWRARGKVRATYGTLIGASEVFSLIQGECEAQFVNYFSRDHVTNDEREAFREFLFGLSYEELELVRRYMEEHGLKVISPDQVRSLLARRVLPPAFGEASPEQMYNSYWRRRLRADYRAISGAPGPRKTAEGYIMEALLRGGDGPPPPAP
ncbi:MAG: hypothetical protein HY721_35835 [Planctomycetes bacterium]|nr:hypothetical protein [Planctomycetota bacterium]